MDKNQVAWSERAARTIIENLRRRRMEGSYASSGAEARDEVLAMIPRGAAVYRCASMTTAGLGLWEGVAGLPGVKIIDHYAPGLSPEGQMVDGRIHVKLVGECLGYG